MIKKCLRGLLVLLVFLFVLIAAILIFTEGPMRKADLYGENTVSKSKKEDFIQYNTSYLYDSDKKLLAKFNNGEGYGNYLPYDKIPENVVNAFVAIEDRTFWENPGYDTSGMIRVVYRYIRSRGKESHGASTITQQLARMHFLSTEKTLSRKFKEISLAKAMTEKYSKKEIMEFYVNNCYFANGQYGIEAAAKYYFRKKAKELTLSETAYLCALPNRPEYFNPREDVQKAMARRDKILRDMATCGYITTAQKREAMAEKIILKDPPENVYHDYQTTYAMDCAVKEIMRQNKFSFTYHFKNMKAYHNYKKRYDKAYDEAKAQFLKGGYRVYTSLDSAMQKEMQAVINDELDDDHAKDKEGVYKFQAAMTVIDNHTGKVVSVIGGRRQAVLRGNYTYNRAYQSYRQPGSSLKPLAVYTPALMKGYTPDQKVTEIDVSVAKHMNNREEIAELGGEEMTLREAVERSRNGVAYSVLNDIGVSYGLNFLNKMRFSKIVPDDYTLSSALGGVTYGVNTVEMASAYAALVNEGTYRPPTCLVSMKDLNGREVYKPEAPVDVYSMSASDTMLSILKGVITSGTARQMNWDSSVEAMGKTGTTNNNKDGWFCGVTKYYTATVWVGYDQPKTLDSLQGATYPASIWKKSMKKLVADYEGQDSSIGEEEYFPGRSDDENLEGGYTVGMYRQDRKIGKKIDALLEEMPDADYENLLALYQECKEYLDEIVSVKYTKEKTEDVEEFYADVLEEREEE